MSTQGSQKFINCIVICLRLYLHVTLKKGIKEENYVITSVTSVWIIIKPEVLYLSSLSLKDFMSKFYKFSASFRF